jgi:hypothetical protein
MRLLGVAADPAYRRASIRVAPVPAVCQQRIDPAARRQDSEAWAVVSQRWPLANPLFVALDLAHDPGRGREISRWLAASAAVAENLVTDGAATQTPVVDLAGKSMLAIVQAIPELAARTGRKAADKERTDLLDIIRLTLDRDAGPSALAQLRQAAPQLAADARLHAHRWFTDLKDHSLRRVRELSEGADVDADTVQLVGELLLAELDVPDH